MSDDEIGGEGRTIGSRVEYLSLAGKLEVSPDVNAPLLRRYLGTVYGRAEWDEVQLMNETA